MAWAVLICLACCLGLTASQAAGPPVILKPSSSNSDYQFEILSSSKDASLNNKYECHATGVNVVINWRVASATDPSADTQALSGNWIESVQADTPTGVMITLETAVFKMAEADEEVFRCVAKSTNGGVTYTTVSSPIKVLIAELFETGTAPIVSNADTGIACFPEGAYTLRPLQFVRQATYQWTRRLTNSQRSTVLKPDVNSNNVMITNDGRLFLKPNVMSDYELTVEGETLKWEYGCRMSADDIDWTQIVNKFVTISLPPTIAYEQNATAELIGSSPETTELVEGELWKGFCLVSPVWNNGAYRFPTLTWGFSNNNLGTQPGSASSDAEGYANIQFPATESLRITCGVQGSILKTFQLTVFEKIALQSPQYMKDVHVGLDGTTKKATFACPLEPAATPVNWLIDGTPVTSNTLWSVDAVAKTLTFNNVLNTTGVSCHALNRAGEFLKNARLLVYSDPNIQVSHSLVQIPPAPEPNTITIQRTLEAKLTPDDGASSKLDDDVFSMTASYTLDQLGENAVTLQWMKFGPNDEPAFKIETRDVEGGLQAIADIVTKGNGLIRNTTLMFDIETIKLFDLEMMKGRYFYQIRYTDCGPASSGCLLYESDEIVVELVGDDVTKQPTVQEPFPYYIVGIAAGVILIILIIIMIVCCVRRNKGEQYYVHDKEIKHGRDPEQELKDHGFKDFTRPDQYPMKGSRMSIAMSDKPHPDSEIGSMDGYADIDTGKFNEDGSFIGQYTGGQPAGVQYANQPGGGSGSQQHMLQQQQQQQPQYAQQQY